MTRKATGSSRGTESRARPSRRATDAPNTIVDCRAWNRTNLFSARRRSSTRPVTQPTRVGQRRGDVGVEPDAVVPSCRVRSVIVTSALATQHRLPGLEHRAGLVVQQDPEGVDAERGAERQHEEIRDGEAERGEPAGSAGAGCSAAPAQALTPPAGEQRDRADRERGGGDAGGHLVALADVDANRDRAGGQQQRRDAEQHADRAPDELQDTEQVEMRCHDAISRVSSQRMLMRTSTMVGGAPRRRDAEPERLAFADAGGHAQRDCVRGGEPRRRRRRSRTTPSTTSPRPPQRGQVRRSGTSKRNGDAARTPRAG